MEKKNSLRLIEVVTDIVTVQISESEEKWMRDVRFNWQLQWVSIRNLKFDWETFYVEKYEEEARKEYLKKKRDEDSKLNREKTEAEKAQDVEELLWLPTFLQEITVIYRKTPTDAPANLALYINEIIKCK